MVAAATNNDHYIMSVSIIIVDYILIRVVMESANLLQI